MVEEKLLQRARDLDARDPLADYRGLFVIEAFGQGVPELIAPGHVWRRTFETEEQLARDAYAFLEPHVAQLPTAS